MTTEGFSNVIGFDDVPFSHHHSGAVPVVGTVYAQSRLDGILIGKIEKDGFDAASRLADLITTSKFAEHVQLVMLQGITLGGFNVVDVFELNARLQIPILVIARHEPDMDRIRQALLAHVPGGAGKWTIIEELGRMERVGNVYIQRVGLSREQATETINRFSIHGNIPEPLRTAHLFAGALAEGVSRGKP